MGRHPLPNSLAQSAIQYLRNRGLAKGFLKWIAIKEEGLLRIRAQKVVMVLANQGKARAFRQWLARWSDNKAQQCAQRA